MDVLLRIMASRECVPSGLVDALHILQDLIPRLDHATNVDGVILRIDVLKRTLVNLGVDDFTLDFHYLVDLLTLL